MHHYTLVAISNQQMPSLHEWDIENKIDHILAPFSFDRQVDEYVYKSKETIVQELDIIKQVANGQKEHAFKRLWASKLLEMIEVKYAEVTPLAYAKIEYSDCRIDDDSCTVYSTHNPYGQYDWYEIGGRWNNHLQLAGQQLTVNAARKKDIQINDEFVPHHYVDPSGTYHHRNDLGLVKWIQTPVTAEEEWETFFWSEFEKLHPEDVLIVVDMHS